MLKRHLFIVFIFLLTCQKSRLQKDEALLLWSSERSRLKVTGIYSTYASPEKQRRFHDFVLSRRVAVLRLPHYISAFDSNDAKGEVTFLDVGRGNLVTVGTHSRTIIRYHRGITNKAEAIAVDWKNGNVYWTDEGRNWIAVMNSKFTHFKVVTKNIGQPRGLALYPGKGLMFWSEMPKDDYEFPKIMRAFLSGENPSRVANVFGIPSALALDQTTDRLYWIDENSMSIYYAPINSNSTDAVLLFRNFSLSLKDIHVFQDWLYVTATKQNQILMLNKTSGELVHVVKTFAPIAVTTMGGGGQPIQPGPCDINNGGCEQLCFALAPGNKRKCGCDLGMEVGNDGKSCAAKIMNRDFFLVVDSDLRWVFQVSADGKKFSKLPLSNARVPVQAEYDPVTSRVFWTDIGDHTVNRANLDGSNHVILAKKNVREPTGIALDRYSGNLYWTDEGSGTINVIKTDGTHHKTLLSHDLKLPRCLVLDPSTGYMWWADWGKGTIERAAMDGTRREVILNRRLSWVNGLAADFKNSKLYWCDAKFHRIESCDLDGKNRKVIIQKSESSHLFGITIAKEFLYYTDWTYPYIRRMGLGIAESQEENFGPEIFDRPSGIISVVEWNDAKANNTNPCEISNGNCTGLCIPVPKNHSSNNDLVNVINNNQYLSTRVCLCGNEYNGTCDKPVSNRDSVPPSFGNTCPDSMTFLSPPCRKEALVDYKIPHATDNSGNVTLEMPAQTPPITLVEGEYEHQYIAIDRAGNHATCKFVIIVKVAKCEPLTTYLDDKKVEVTNISCGVLFGSRVQLHCVNATKKVKIQFLECEQDGHWSGEHHCTNQSSVVSLQTATATPQIEPPTNKSTSLQPTPNDNATKMEKLQTTNGSHHLNLQSQQHIMLLIPIFLVIIIVFLSACLYRKYRSSSIPLLVALQRTVSFKNDKSDNFNLDIGEESHSPDEGETVQEETRENSTEITPTRRRSSLPIAKENPGHSGTSNIEKKSQSNYGTIK